MQKNRKSRLCRPFLEVAIKQKIHLVQNGRRYTSSDNRTCDHSYQEAQR